MEIVVLKTNKLGATKKSLNYIKDYKFVREKLSSTHNNS